jgi:hypothetical protein
MAVSTVSRPGDTLVPAPLDLRLGTIRKARRASRLSSAMTLGVWMAALDSLMTIAGGGLLSFR